MNDLYFTGKNKKGLQGRKTSRQTCFYANKFNEILLCRMKSKQAWMKSSPTASDEIKSVSLYPCEARFHRVAISSTKGGFIPTKADLTEKDSELYPILSLFLVRKTGLEPVRCKPHAPQTCASASSATSALPFFDDSYIIHLNVRFVNTFLKNNYNFFEKLAYFRRRVFHSKQKTFAFP